MVSQVFVGERLYVALISVVRLLSNAAMALALVSFAESLDDQILTSIQPNVRRRSYTTSGQIIISPTFSGELRAGVTAVLLLSSALAENALVRRSRCLPFVSVDSRVAIKCDKCEPLCSDGWIMPILFFLQREKFVRLGMLPLQLQVRQRAMLW